MENIAVVPKFAKATLQNNTDRNLACMCFQQDRKPFLLRSMAKKRPFVFIGNMLSVLWTLNASFSAASW